MLPFLLLSAVLQVTSPKVAAAAPPVEATTPLAPLSVYNGVWTVHALHPWSGGKPGTADRLVSHCTLNQAFFSCEQIINEKPAQLIVFVAAGEPDKFYTRNVTPTGLASPRGEMTISGEHHERWTYLDKSTQGEKTTWYRVENYFKGPDHIHYEEFESPDNVTWTKTNEGEEVRQPN